MPHGLPLVLAIGQDASIWNILTLIAQKSSVHCSPCTLSSMVSGILSPPLAWPSKEQGSGERMGQSVRLLPRRQFSSPQSHPLAMITSNSVCGPNDGAERHQLKKRGYLAQMEHFRFGALSTSLISPSESVSFLAHSGERAVIAGVSGSACEACKEGSG